MQAALPTWDCVLMTLRSPAAQPSTISGSRRAQLLLPPHQCLPRPQRLCQHHHRRLRQTRLMRLRMNDQPCHRHARPLWARHQQTACSARRKTVQRRSALTFAATERHHFCPWSVWPWLAGSTVPFACTHLEFRLATFGPLFLPLVTIAALPLAVAVCAQLFPLLTIH